MVLFPPTNSMVRWFPEAVPTCPASLESMMVGRIWIFSSVEYRSRKALVIEMGRHNLLCGTNEPLPSGHWKYCTIVFYGLLQLAHRRWSCHSIERTVVGSMTPPSCFPRTKELLLSSAVDVETGSHSIPNDYAPISMIIYSFSVIVHG